MLDSLPTYAGENGNIFINICTEGFMVSSTHNSGKVGLRCLLADPLLAVKQAHQQLRFGKTISGNTGCRSIK
jgi:hypothetical protein